MSDTPNNNSGDGSQGEPPQSGQPSSAQGSQPQPGQAAGGQPVQGQAPRGQPQGGAQPQGQPAQGQAPQGNYQTGPSVSDIFSRNDTLDQIKLGVVMYAIVGFGLGIALFGVGTAFSNPSNLGSAFQAAGVIAGSLVLPAAVSVVLAAMIGRRHDEELSEVEDTLVFATSGVTAFAGSIVVFLLTIVLLGIGAGSVSFDNLFVPMITTGIGAAIISVGTIWTERNLLTPSGAPPQGRQQY